MKHKLVCAIVALGTVLSLSGCWVLDLIPSALIPASYIVNHEGHYFAGTRCGIALIEIGVFTYQAMPLLGESVEWRDAVWHAVLDPPIDRVELFTADQPGVTVVRDTGELPLSDTVWVYMLDSNERWLARLSLTVVLSDLADGQLRYRGPETSWEEYLKIPDRDFGC